jgi:hypothetical protein
MKDILTIIESRSWVNEHAKEIAIQLVLSFDQSVKNKTKNGWTNCLLFVGQTFPRDNSNITLIAAVISNPFRLRQEIERIKSKSEPQPEIEQKPTVRRGRKKASNQ